MAALKTELLAAYQDQHGVPLRSRMFGSIRTLNRLGSAAFPLSNLAGGWRPARLLAERWLGVSAARPLPRFQRQDLRSWFRAAASPRCRPAPGELIFLADCFTTFTEPAAGRAAIELLELAGWRVRFQDAGCCGRASLSNGQVDPARRMAAGMAGRIAEAAARGAPIVAVEPSCLLTLRDEYLALLPGDPQCWRSRPPRGCRRNCSWRPSPPAGSSCRGTMPSAAAASCSTVTATRRRSQAPPRRWPCSAASRARGHRGRRRMLRHGRLFGFEAEHYELSMSIGELRLFPAIRA